jgi:hypothetical protein
MLNVGRPSTVRIPTSGIHDRAVERMRRDTSTDDPFMRDGEANYAINVVIAAFRLPITNEHRCNSNGLNQIDIVKFRARGRQLRDRLLFVRHSELQKVVVGQDAYGRVQARPECAAASAEGCSANLEAAVFFDSRLRLGCAPGFFPGRGEVGDGSLIGGVWNAGDREAAADGRQ